MPKNATHITICRERSESGEPILCRAPGNCHAIRRERDRKGPLNSGRAMISTPLTTLDRWWSRAAPFSRSRRPRIAAPQIFPPRAFLSTGPASPRLELCIYSIIGFMVRRKLKCGLVLLEALKYARH